MGESVNLESRRALLKQFAPQYREASYAQKRVLLNVFAQATGYHRRYGMWLLNHAEDVLQAPVYKRSNHYGPEVQHALFLVWHAANRICAKRLIPFLPTLVEALERHEHLHLSEECRSQLLSMSAATADRLLRSQRKLVKRGLSTTRSGTLLKQQIPVRTFAEWEETRPGFLEAERARPLWYRHRRWLPVHGSRSPIEPPGGQNAFLSCIAAGRRCWLPSNGHARSSLFRSWGLIPITVGRRINEVMVAYCDHEQITFTRGRPYQTRVQCIVEQKNGVIVRKARGL